MAAGCLLLKGELGEGLAGPQALGCGEACVLPAAGTSCAASQDAEAKSAETVRCTCSAGREEAAWRCVDGCGARQGQAAAAGSGGDRSGSAVAAGSAAC